MAKLGKVFMLDDDIFFLNLYHDMLDKRGYEVFSTTNAYKFLLYSKEIHPDIFILDVNMPDVSGWEVLHLLDEESKKRSPVLMTTVSADKELAVAKGVAHYLQKPFDLDHFLEIVEVYCQGEKQHDILLIRDYDPFSEKVLEDINDLGLSCFEVNDAHAADIYLRRNHPKTVCVNIAKSRYDDVKSSLKHDKIFYVENRADIENLVSLLK